MCFSIFNACNVNPKTKRLEHLPFTIITIIMTIKHPISTQSSSTSPSNNSSTSIFIPSIQTHHLSNFKLQYLPTNRVISSSSSMANSEVNSGKCYSGIIRRLLCSGSLPTYPSDELNDSNDVKEIDDQKPKKSLQPEADAKQDATSTPGVVARLMGLDSFPIAQKDRTLGSYFRSRSANSIDFYSHFDPVKQGHGQHRRVRTAVSFSEGDDYYSVLLPFEEVDETLEYQEELLRRKRDNVNVGRTKKSENFQEKKVIKKPSKKIEMEVKRRPVCGEFSSGSNAVYQKKDLHGRTRVCLKERRPIIKSKEECVKKKKKRISAHKVHPESSVPETRSRKPLVSQTANSEGANSDNGEGRAIMKDKSGRKDKSKESCYYKTIVDEIFRLTEEDFKENWVHGMVVKFEDFEEMCQQFGQEILEVLLKQFVDELVLQRTNMECI